MRIKKHPSGNDYVACENVWVRDFTKKSINPLQLTHMFDHSDYHLLLKNEEMNKNYPNIANEKIAFKGAVIVSDGYDFEKRHLFLNQLPKDIAILAVNRALAKWGLMSLKIPSQSRRTINAYVVNNPYKECVKYTPPRDAQYYPVCLASMRTNYEFLRGYLGDVYTYTPTPEMTFGLERTEEYYIDDYRNPICAALSLVYHFNVQKILLLCCDDSFEEKRDFAVQLENGLYTYPQHIKSQKIIDANLYWLSKQETRKVEVADYSSGGEYNNAVYIKSEEEAINYFMGQEEGTHDVKHASIAT
jgi:hypothetical protein